MIITQEQKEINGYQCKKAKLESNPKVNVWFTPETAYKLAHSFKENFEKFESYANSEILEGGPNSM